MNNFVFSQDPLLYQPRYSQPMQMDMDIKQQQLSNAVEQYKALQQNMQNTLSQEQPRDYIGELDEILRGLSTSVAEQLASDSEYMAANNELQSLIQSEIVRSVKWKVNSNPEIIRIAKEQKDAISRVKNACETEERKNLNELNDYIKNYSDITFDEYKKIKEGKKNDNR